MFTGVKTLKFGFYEVKSVKNLKTVTLGNLIIKIK
jgi:hypothetical protein